VSLDDPAHFQLGLADPANALTMEERMKLLESAVNFITEALQTHRHAKVLVHGEAGISRSACVVMAYLVAKEKSTLKKIWKQVHAARPVVWPSFGLMDMLIRWEEQHRQKTASMRLSQYKLWCEFEPDAYVESRTLDRVAEKSSLSETHQGT